MSNDFCDLPQELQMEILSNLDAVSLLRCAMTCTSIYETLQGSPLLTYTMELHRDGLKDAGTSLSYPDLIESLRRRRQAWLSLEIKESLVHLTQSHYDAVDLVGGVYANMSKHRFEMLRLPTASNVKAHAFQRPSVAISALNFTMDPTQDLMVVLEDDNNPQSLHLRSISSNATHPQAQQSPLQWSHPPYTHMNVVSINPVVIQIAGNILAIFFQNTQVRVWDWTTSDLIFKLDCAVSPDRSLLASMDDFRLLDSTYFLTTCRSNFGSIRLYSVVRPQRQEKETATQAIHLATLHFPPLAQDVTILGIQSESGPIEANPLPGEPFSIDDDARVHVFTVVYNHCDVADPRKRESSSLTLFLHQRLLLKYARRVLTDDLSLDIPWAEWGPLNTRFTYILDQYVSQGWERYIHGQRVIFPEGEIEGLYSSIKIADFSLAAVLFAKGLVDIPSSASSSKGMPGTLSLSSTIRTADLPIFVDDVETHLPCVTSILDLEETNEMYMIYANGFIGADVRPQLPESALS